jgi:hypothetical protein
LRHFTLPQVGVSLLDTGEQVRIIAYAADSVDVALRIFEGLHRVRLDGLSLQDHV